MTRIGSEFHRWVGDLGSSVRIPPFNSGRDYNVFLGNLHFRCHVAQDKAFTSITSKDSGVGHVCTFGNSKLRTILRSS